MKTTNRFANVLCCAAFCTFAGGAPAAEQTKAPPTKSFVYKKTKQANLEIVVNYPPGWKGTDKRPGIVFFFGGAFQFGSIQQFEYQAAYFATRGMVAARADYRVRDRHGVMHDTCVEDAKSAMRWFRQNAAMLGVDPNRIVASGGSAGGYLAACLACPGLDAKGEPARVSTKPNAMILFNPYLPFVSQQSTWTIVPTLHVAKDTPPTLMFFGTQDDLLKNAKEFLARSKAVGQRAELFLAEGVGHGFFNAQNPVWRDRTLYRADEFLASLGYLAGKPTISKP